MSEVWCLDMHYPARRTGRKDGRTDGRTMDFGVRPLVDATDDDDDGG